MSKFCKLLEQEYLKLDVKEHELTDIQKSVVDKMVSSEKGNYEGTEKNCAVVSYNVDGKQGKIKIDPMGKITKHGNESGEDEESTQQTSGSMGEDDLQTVKKLMNPTDKKKIDTAVQNLVGTFTNKIGDLSKKLSNVK
jgi:c-di-AMP phosphodiesterase-like protein